MTDPLALRALTPAEVEILELLGDVSNAFRDLPAPSRLQDADVRDFCTAIRTAQNIVLARPGTEVMATVS